MPATTLLLTGLVVGTSLLGARHWLHRGLTPVADTSGPTPASIGLTAETVWIPAAQGSRLFAWYLPSRDPAPAPAAAPGVDTGRLVALGHSVGAAATLLVASRRPGLAAAVSVSAFAHPEWVMRRWLAARRVPYWPLGWLVNRYVERVIGARFDTIAPLATLPQARCPVLLLHGRQDVTVPLSDAHALVDQAGASRAHLQVLDGGHEGFDDPVAAEKAVLEFLTSALRTD